MIPEFPTKIDLPHVDTAAHSRPARTPDVGPAGNPARLADTGESISLGGQPAPLIKKSDQLSSKHPAENNNTTRKVSLEHRLDAATETEQYRTKFADILNAADPENASVWDQHIAAQARVRQLVEMADKINESPNVVARRAQLTAMREVLTDKLTEATAQSDIGKIADSTQVLNHLGALHEAHTSSWRSAEQFAIHKAISSHGQEATFITLKNARRIDESGT